MKLYCERTLIDSKTGFYEVILAFSSDKDMLIFSELFGLNTEVNNGTVLLLTEIRFKKYFVLVNGIVYLNLFLKVLN